MCHIHTGIGVVVVGMVSVWIKDQKWKETNHQVQETLPQESS